MHIAYSKRVLRHFVSWSLFCGLLFALSADAGAASADARTLQVADVRAVRLHQTPSLEAIAPELARQRVVFVGETHDAYAHHLIQLAIIRDLHARDPNLAIGLEMFQRPFQKVLDRFVAGDIDTREMLVQSEYFRRWRFDYRLYAPILDYAREHGIALVALNAEHELAAAVSRTGLEGLSDHDREALPRDIDESNQAYRQRLQNIFESHPGSGDFEAFHQVQLVWDETMAETAADYLLAHPQRRMVILAGHGHLAYGDGIPQRMARRMEAPMAIVLNDWPGPFDPALADYLLLSEPRELPPRGELGVLLQTDEAGGVRVTELVEGGSAAKGGLRQNDVITHLDGHAVLHPSHVQAALWDAAPGQVVTLTRRTGEPQELRIALREGLSARPTHR